MFECFFAWEQLTFVCSKFSYALQTNDVQYLLLSFPTALIAYIFGEKVNHSRKRKVGNEKNSNNKNTVIHTLIAEIDKNHSKTTKCFISTSYVQLQQLLCFSLDVLNQYHNKLNHLIQTDETD